MPNLYRLVLSAVHPWEPSEVSANLKFEAQPYGWDITPDHGEWQLTLRATARQDGRVAWLVSLTEVDGDVRLINGLDAYEVISVSLQRAIANLVAHVMPEFDVQLALR